MAQMIVDSPLPWSTADARPEIAARRARLPLEKPAMPASQTPGSPLDGVLVGLALVAPFWIAVAAVVMLVLR